ncbi:hypothetical protein ACIGXM_02285 [Kitasatospora sp. NPDC052896]|uniref:hypothetical protein n=1 Tax=Kitasatospora sp. NPDC052896 TaxID=3364061 RepID=UPI0037C8EEFC
MTGAGMTEGLEGYWEGDFTLHDTGDADSSGTRSPDLPPDRLARPDITVHGRNLADLLAPLYRAMTS